MHKNTWVTEPPGLNFYLFVVAKALKFNDIVKLEMMKLMFDNYHNDLPETLLDLFTCNTSIHRYNTRHARDPHMEIYKYKVVSESFLHKGPFEWTKLSHAITSSKTKGSFISKLKNIYIVKLYLSY